MHRDETLLKRYAGGRDADAFAELVQRYARLVYSTCFRITGNTQDAEDATQESFLELAKSAGTIKTSLPAWLHRVAKNRSINMVRDQITRGNYERKALTEQAGPHEPDWSDIAPYVDHALEQLPEHLRTPLLLHYIEGMSQAAIAAHTKTSQPTVSRTLQKGIGELREALKQAGVIVSITALAAMLADNGALSVPHSTFAALGKIALSGVGTATSTGLLSTITQSLTGTALGKAAVIAILATLPVMLGIRLNAQNQASQQDSAHIAPPTVEAVSAALQKQYTAIPCLKVTWMDGDDRECNYTRTLGMQRLDFKDITGYNSYSFERDTTQSLSFRQSNNGELTGGITKGHDGYFTTRTFMESSLYTLYQQSDNELYLYEQIKRGSVLPKTTPIDGHACWCIEVPPPPGMSRLIKQLVWVDPSINYNPRRVEYLWNDQVSGIVDFQNYKEIANGVWFPLKQLSQWPDDSGKNRFTHTNTVTTIKVEAAPPKEDLRVSFPSGTKVTTGLSTGKVTTFIVP